MTHPSTITTLFLDIGGVLLTNGWSHESRKLAANTFHFDYGEMEGRHHLTYDTYETGKITLDEYLDRIVFYVQRPFTRRQFIRFMFAQSKPFPKMIALIRTLKEKYGLKIAVVSNEASEVNDYRIRKFKLDRFVDFFLCSAFVHLRKPDFDIYRMALDISHVRPDHVLYIEDRAMFIQVAASLGIHTLQHTDFASTREKLASFGLT